MNEAKQRILAKIDSEQENILRISHDIHDNPELGLREFKAAGWLCDYLEQQGFTVERGAGGISTAFVGVLQGSGEGPAVAIIAEYDALAGIGHGCGHNVIAASAVGAAAGIAAVLKETAGRVAVIGTPAEETVGCKIDLLEAGVFDPYEFTIEVHPTAGQSHVCRGGRACVGVTAAFTGVSSHSASPASGVNALSAAMEMFHDIDALRPLFDPMDNVNGCITEGGQASNVITGFAKASFTLRSDTLYHLEALTERVKHAADCAAMLFGAKVEVSVGNMFAERYSNRTMGLRFKENLEALGEEVVVANPFGAYGSSDIGNVSIKMPAIHEYVSIGPWGLHAHSTELSEAAVSPRGDRGCILAAKAIAMTAYDLLTDAEFRAETLRTFREQVPELYRKRSGQ